jgi:fluoride ion exporter CrcB/FEX
VARRLHQLVNPKMAVEEAAMKVRREEGVYLNHNLPDFERRYLHELYQATSIVREAREFYGDLFPVERLEAIEKWRKSTKRARRVNHPLLPLLVEIENMTLVQNYFPIPEHLAEAAKTHDWDVDALREWQNNVSCAMLPSMRSSHADIIMTPELPSSEQSKWLSISVSAAILTAFIAFQIAGLALLTGQNSYTITNRNMAYSLLFAPSGALLRWKLSNWNGTLPYRDWRWFPFGTFTANLIGSIVSISCIAIEYNLNSAQINSFWGIGTIRAIKVGFAGCLTTVSTFVAESSGFMKNTDHAYPYMLTTIACCCPVACLIYGIILWADTL